MLIKLYETAFIRSREMLKSKIEQRKQQQRRTLLRLPGLGVLLRGLKAILNEPNMLFSLDYIQKTLPKRERKGSRHFVSPLFFKH